MDENEWQESFDKWKEICHLIVVRGWNIVGQMHGQCSYCHDFMVHTKFGHDCSGCPLYKKNACSDDPNYTKRFWRCRTALHEGRWHHALGHAKALLKAIVDTKKEVVNANDQ